MRTLLLFIIFFNTTAFAASEMETIKLRIAPVGKINIAPASAPAPLPAATAPSSTSKPQAVTASTDIGQKIYQSKCVVCHGTGLAGAPKFGNKTDWSPRAKQGIDILLTHAEQGYKAMPARGTCTECSDADLKKTIEYMLKNSQITL